VDLEAVDSLCASLVAASRSTATRAKYATAWRHYLRFTTATKELSPWLTPCRLDDLESRQLYGKRLARFAAFLAMGAVSAATVKKYVGHVRSLHHERFGVVFLDDLVLVQRVLEGLVAKEALVGDSPESRRKAPFTWGMFRAIAQLLQSPADAEFLTAVATGLGFLLRASELLPDGVTNHHLRRRDVVFGPRDLAETPLWVAINIRSSKVHKVRRLRALARSDDRIGVCRILWDWHQRSGGYARPADPLFPTISRGGLSARLRLLATSLGMGEARRLASHSLRRGGATSLLASGVPPHVIQRFGRWASDMWVDTYAELEFDQQLALAAALEGCDERRSYGCKVRGSYFDECLRGVLAAH
jgi:integrase